MKLKHETQFNRLLPAGVALLHLAGCGDADTCADLQQFAQDFFRQALAAFLF